MKRTRRHLIRATWNKKFQRSRKKGKNKLKKKEEKHVKRKKEKVFKIDEAKKNFSFKYLENRIESMKNNHQNNIKIQVKQIYDKRTDLNNFNY